ncbi:protein PFC0760c-like [Physella acuta]|uniref:protein PFC0760c-like n=1 Tax=Physella acuta TaxID=109671 RepID=UPI0027DBCD51|nr:protein PFC0760c-like [Physella acuta]
MSENSECAVPQSSQELEDTSSDNLGPKQSIVGEEQLLPDTSVVQGELTSEHTESTTLERDGESESVNSGHEKCKAEELKPGVTESILLERESSIDKKQMNSDKENTQSDTVVLGEGFTVESSNTILKCENKNVSKLLYSGDDLTQSDAAVVEGGLQFENTDSTHSVSERDERQIYNEEEQIFSNKAGLENGPESLCTDSTPLKSDSINDGKQQNKEELKISDSAVLEEGSISENIDSTLVAIDREGDINVMSNDNSQSVHATHDVLDNVSPLISNTDESAMSDKNAQVSIEVKDKNNEMYDDQTMQVDGCDLHNKNYDQFTEEIKPDNVNTALLNTPDEEISIDNFVVITSTELEELSMEEKTPTNEVMLSYSKNLDDNKESDGLEITLTQSCLKEEGNTQKEMETYETLKELNLNTNLSVDEKNANLGNWDTIIQSNESSQSIGEVENTIHNKDLNNKVKVEAESVDDKEKGKVEQDGDVKILDPSDGDAETQKEIIDVEEDLFLSTNAENDDPSNELGKEDVGNSDKSSDSKFVEEPSSDDTTDKISLFVDNILNSVSTAQLNNSNEITNPPDLNRLVESENNTISAINTLAENNDSVNSLDEDDLKPKTQTSNEEVGLDIDILLTGNTTDENTNFTTEVQDSIDSISINLAHESCQSLITDEKIPDFESDGSKIQKQIDENITVPSSENEAAELESSSDISHVDSCLPDTTKQCESEAVDPCESVLAQEQHLSKTEEKHNEEEYADSNYTSLSSVDIEDSVSEVNENNETLETSRVHGDETQELSSLENTFLESRSNDLNSQTPESGVAQPFSNAQNTTANTTPENRNTGNAVATAIKLGGIAAAGIGAALAAPILISTLGFEAGGIVAGSIAELLMETANSIGFGTMALSALESVGVEGLDIGTQVLIGVAGASTAGGVVAVAEVMRRNVNADLRSEERILDRNNGGKNGELDHNTSTSNYRMDDLDSNCTYESRENLENASIEETNSPDNFRNEVNHTEKQNFENDNLEHSNQHLAIGNASTDCSTTVTVSPDSTIESDATQELDHDIVADVIENLKTTVEETQKDGNGKMEEESKGVFVCKQDDEKLEDNKNKIEEEAKQDLTYNDENNTQRDYTHKDENETRIDYTHTNDDETQLDYIHKYENETQLDYTHKDENETQLDYTHKDENETRIDYAQKDKNETKLDYTHTNDDETHQDYTHIDEEETQESSVDKLEEDTLHKETQLDCKDKLRGETNEITEQEK